jgi:hypothetical protein
MKKLTLTYDEALADLKALVEEKGEDYIYQTDPESGCLYFHDKERPGCIVGHVMAKHGIKQDDLVHGSADWNFNKSVHGLFKDGFLDIDERTGYLLAIAQTLQDDHTPWGQAVSVAVERADQPGVDYEFLFKVKEEA